MNSNRQSNIKGKKMKKIVSSILLLSSVYASAGENYFQNEWDAKGLIGLEGSLGSTQMKQTEENPNGGEHVIVSDKKTAFAGGLKLGGESEHYRLFLSGRYHGVTDFDSVLTLGAEMQYLIRAGEHFNIFMGVNGGQMVSQMTVGTIQYTANNTYAGGDAGINIDVFDNFGIELGVRGMKTLGDTSDVGSISFIVEGYASLVFKFTGSY